VTAADVITIYAWCREWSIEPWMKGFAVFWFGLMGLAVLGVIGALGAWLAAEAVDAWRDRRRAHDFARARIR
jgi:hypothetical protein